MFYFGAYFIQLSTFLPLSMFLTKKSAFKRIVTPRLGQILSAFMLSFN